MEEEEGNLGHTRAREFHWVYGKIERKQPYHYPIFHKYLERWECLVGNQRMGVSEDIIAEATGLDMEGINFYWDRKL